MVPGKTDPLWAKFVTEEKEYTFSSLATKLMYSRIKQHIRGGGSKEEAIDIAYDFFVKNEKITSADLAMIQS